MTRLDHAASITPPRSRRLDHGASITRLDHPASIPPLDRGTRRLCRRTSASGGQEFLGPSPGPSGTLRRALCGPALAPAGACTGRSRGIFSPEPWRRGLCRRGSRGEGPQPPLLRRRSGPSRRAPSTNSEGRLQGDQCASTIGPSVQGAVSKTVDKAAWKSGRRKTLGPHFEASSRRTSRLDDGDDDGPSVSTGLKTSEGTAPSRRCRLWDRWRAVGGARRFSPSPGTAPGPCAASKGAPRIR
ncbi:hypothetical protein M885DRAFT_28483 [Pelagophyceae sp. CCMP2097]|nr:hypothetical protein M885DRAFT_28483 [Pelagophyceae sp. CCMP2097]